MTIHLGKLFPKNFLIIKHKFALLLISRECTNSNLTNLIVKYKNALKNRKELIKNAINNRYNILSKVKYNIDDNNNIYKEKKLRSWIGEPGMISATAAIFCKVYICTVYLFGNFLL